MLVLSVFWLQLHLTKSLLNVIEKLKIDTSTFGIRRPRPHIVLQYLESPTISDIPELLPIILL